MMLGSGDNEALGRMGMISGLPLQQNPVTISGDVAAMSGSLKKDDRVPQWSNQETREFIAIQAELERDVTLSRRNKTVWEVVAAKMKERGYWRSPDQCKCKWKALVNRYKGKETSDLENGRQCPFFEELHAVFAERAKKMQQMLLESESGGVHAKKKIKRQSGEFSSDDFSDNDELEEGHLTKTQKRKAERKPRATTIDKSRGANSIQELLQDFLQQQQRMEMQWREMVDRRAQERRMFEQEWRQTMEKMERDRLMMEQAWWEREEQRRMREESRAEKRDALITTLLNTLMHEDL